MTSHTYHDRFPHVGDPDTDFARFTKQTWDGLDSFYRPWVGRWRRVMDFLRSQHWNVFKDLNVDQVPKWKRFPVANYTLAIYSDMLIQWMQSKVRFTAIPDSPDPEEVGGAELADHILRYVWDRVEMDDKRLDIGAWLLSTGNCDVRVYWNTNTGDMIPLALPMPDGSLVPINPETMKPDFTMKKPVMVDAGEIGIDILSPQLVRWSMDESHGVMVGYLLSREQVAQRYGQAIAEKLHYRAHESPLSLDLLSLQSPGATSASMDRALVVEHYLPRSSENSEGLWWTASEQQIVTEPNPLPAGTIPIVHFRWIPIAGHKHFGMTPLYDVTFSNKTYDRALQKTEQWAEKVVPKWLFEAGSGLRVGDFTDEPGQEFQVNAGTKIQAIALPEPPKLFSEMRRDQREDMLVVAGYKFQRPKELPAGETKKGTRQPPKLINQGEQMALATIASGPSWTKMGYILLGYVGRFYTESRTGGVVGPDRVYQWREFKGADILDLRTRLRVDELPLYPWNKQSMRDTVLGLLDSQSGQMLFTGRDGEVDMDRIEAAMEVVGLDVNIAATDPDVLEARNENNTFKNLQEEGQGPQVMPWQNNEQHISEHHRLMKSTIFGALPQYVQEALMQHVSGHEQAIEEAQQAKQQAMMEQEQALRQIRADADVSENVKSYLGEKMIELLVETLGSTVKPEGKKKE